MCADLNMDRHVSNGLLCHSCDSAIPSLISVHFHVICCQVLSVDIALGVRLGYFMYEIYGQFASAK